MKYNPRNILIDSLKDEGLHIIDKRGIKFDDEAERNMIWEGNMLVDWYADYLRDMDVDFPYSDGLWGFHQAVQDFRHEISA